MSFRLRYAGNTNVMITTLENEYLPIFIYNNLTPIKKDLRRIGGFYELPDFKELDSSRSYTLSRGQSSPTAFFKNLFKEYYKTVTKFNIGETHEMWVTNYLGTLICGVRDLVTHEWERIVFSSLVVKSNFYNADIPLETLGNEHILFIVNQKAIDRYPDLKKKMKPVFKFIEDLNIDMLITSDVEKWVFNPFEIKMPTFGTIPERQAYLNTYKSLFYE